VTGGANGLGKEIAIKLAAVGCNVAIADVNLKDARLTAEEIACKFNVKTMAYHADVSDFNSVQLLKEQIESTLGFVDILVNNAGILTLISLREGTPADIQRIIDTNLTSHFWVIAINVEILKSNIFDRLAGHFLME
jgi:all-trans-retinol dehydrogenase (NAD+)